MDADQIRLEGLRQAVTEGAILIHRAVEAAAVQDAARPLQEPELQLVGRGIELLAKVAWILNDRILTGEFHRPRRFGHDLVSLLSAVDEQAAALDLPRIWTDPLIRRIADVAEGFARGGRFDHIEALALGESSSWQYLAWNELQNMSVHLSGLDLSSQELRTAYLRRVHTAALQRLERSLAAHILAGQHEIWTLGRICRAWLEAAATRADEDMGEAIPIGVRDWPCRCAELDRRIAVWAPVERP